MGYKILIKVGENDENSFFKFYKEENVETDWSTENKEEAIKKLEELLGIYSSEELVFIVDLDFINKVEIPSLLDV